MILRLRLFSMFVIGLILLPVFTMAGPQDLVEYPAEKISDVTMDATDATLYFQIGGIRYVYGPFLQDRSISMPDLVESIRGAKSLLIAEENPRQSRTYYDGQTAQAVLRILVKW